nr:hypothetical protein BV87_24225 [Sphingobium yanoikuyae]
MFLAVVFDIWPLGNANHPIKSHLPKLKYEIGIFWICTVYQKIAQINAIFFTTTYFCGKKKGCGWF